MMKSLNRTESSHAANVSGWICRSSKLLFYLGILTSVFPGIEKSVAQESPHGKIRFECKTCHTTETWKIKEGGIFNHESTGFALTGQHTSLQCVSCHQGLKFPKKSSDCLSCHTDVHKSEMGNNCLRCHTTQSWKIADMVQRHQSTRFPLLGKHSTLPCQTCHTNAARKQFAGTPTDCFGCHQEDFSTARSPNHVASGFSTDCMQCHDVTAFRWGSGFRHELTRFPLTGAHVAASCFACHKNQVFKSTPTVCVSCHQTEYTLTANPNHVLGNFNHDCVPCHTTTAWMPSTFSHTNTPFPLVGAHQAVSCNQCHINNQYQNLPHACWDCHSADFNATTNPNHQQGQFSHDCLTCHTQAAWQPATFNHSSTNFPLTGAHTATACISCHVNGNYQLTYTNCYQCHATQYAIPTNPNHVTLQLGHDCTPCHTQSAWLPSTYNHDQQYFRIYSGKHRNKWTGCSQCHPSIGQYQNFTCISCHEHRQSEMNNKHQGVPGYQYNSPACYSCHRNV